MKTDMITPCRTMTDLQSCLEADTHCVPTVEFTVRNFELPLNSNDLAFLAAPEINLFAARDVEARSTAAAQAYATSRNLTDTTLTFDVPFILLGICVYAYGDPYSTLVEGNQFYPQQCLADFNRLPASPMNLRRPLTAGLFGGDPPASFDEVEPAQIDWGGPTWRAISAFLHAYRLEMRCPSSSYDLLMDEALADIGNCCSQIEWGGYGHSKTSHIRVTRNINDRLAANRANMPGGTDPGFFVPINCEQDETGVITPQRYVGDEAAYGRPITMPAVEQWYRLPCPIPFPSIPQPKLKITLKKANGDEGYVARMIQEMSMDDRLNPVPGLASSQFPINDINPQQWVPDGGYGGFTRIPGGQMRIGIGLKGFEVRASVCEDLMAMLEGKTFAELRSNPQTRFLTEGVANGGQIISTPYQGPSKICVPFGLGNPKEQG